MNICDQIDCPLHPDYYEEAEEKPEVLYRMSPDGKISMNIQNHNHNIGDISIGSSGAYAQYDGSSWQAIANQPQETLSSSTGDSIIDLANTIKFQTKNITCHIECMFCEHKKSIDMRKECIASRAKELLEG